MLKLNVIKCVLGLTLWLNIYSLCFTVVVVLASSTIPKYLFYNSKATFTLIFQSCPYLKIAHFSED